MDDIKLECNVQVFDGKTDTAMSYVTDKKWLPLSSLEKR